MFLAVGLEGVFGIAGIAIFVLLASTGESIRSNFTDVVYYVRSYKRLGWATVAYCVVTIINMVSGYLVTHTAGAATRATFNSIRPYFVFIIGFALGLESFEVWRQFGYVISVVAVMMFNDVLVVIQPR